MNNKVGKTHLQRRAVVYLRQSTLSQVESNRESTERQYALADRAQQLGWDKSQIQILDGDLGKSGQTTTGREDFHRLMAAVGLGEVGAVFALEASRFSRSQADWHKLLDICALTDTLVIDHDGVYNPNDFNDRVLLGFKGTWSHTELHGMRLRLQGAKLNKAKKGELRCTPPTGYVYDADKKLVLDPDEGVVAAIRLVFQQFRLLGTAFKVMRYFASNQISFPQRVWRPGEIGTLQWGPINHSRILAILHNPTYTGTYVYGRRRSQPVVDAGQITKMKTQLLPQSDWKVMIHHTHPAYISWQEFQENQQQLVLNHGAIMADGRQGSAREGAALLQGLVICGKCGRRMSPRYHGTGGKRSTYQCDRLRQQNGVHGICWSVPGATIDTAVAHHLLEVLSASNLDISLAVLDELEQNAQQQEQQWQLRLERVRYEAERAERQFNAVEPENRLVARTLEKRWNEKLQQLVELEEAYAQAQLLSRLEISDEQRQQILNLASNIPAVWHSPTTTASERKEMLRLLVKQVALTPMDHPTRQTQVKILWHTGATSELFTPRPSIQQKLGTPVEVIQAIRELAVGRTDTEIARELNCQGFLSPKGRAFTESSVAWIRLKYKIDKPGSNPKFAHDVGIRTDGCYSTSALAAKLGVGIDTIHYWREQGIIPASQETPNGPWWHQVTPEILKTLRDKIRRVPVRVE
ncbi:MAG TPA: recombinase family protein [Cyanobacteria bacterium UBA11049]|nr:recombinase family protein [Cyanobacteria bacterium UBA11049]